MGLQRVLRRAAVRRGSRLVPLGNCCLLSASQHGQDAAYYYCMQQTTVLYCSKVCSLHGPLALIGGSGPRLGWNREAQNPA